MSETHDNIIDATTRFSPSDHQNADLDRQRRDGQRLLHHKNRLKLSTEDREIVARNIGYLLTRHRIERRELAHTAACTTRNITAKELHDLVLGLGERAIAHRLRADVSKYRAVILGLGELTRIDAPLLANTVFSGTAIHPSSGSMRSEIENLIQLLYDITEALDSRYNLSNRFSTLAQRRSMLPVDAPFACWPGGAPCTPSLDLEAVVSPYWWDGLVRDYFRGDTYLENTSLRDFLRYMPHFYLGIDDNFDDNWPFPREMSIHSDTSDERCSSQPGRKLLWDDILLCHPERDTVKNRNRNRLAETVGDVARQQLNWDDTGKTILINGLSEEDLKERGREHMRRYMKEIGLEENWERDGGEMITEQGIWICLYPSWKSTIDRVPNLLPVIVRNYGMAGANGTITIDSVDIWLESIAKSKLVTGLTVLERLEEVLSADTIADEPEAMSELRRTVSFIEHHPLLQRARKLEAGARKIREYREQALRRTEEK
ncbi:hypothetical protein F2Q65_12955 [Thiohalocapsa marina]|uniref:Uncharacterized protein n=1 Tax=Thiohalocapsa marina TaxID=424902 RepID=A0A5M8FHM4_9GAMM|nr:hypothetical protein [Thiohalocapsa marina]KAA6184219.1 hypothetical protein F2Q65_12955 [Thiohalocapsa marina]